jgi:hypothetical protein
VIAGFVQHAPEVVPDRAVAVLERRAAQMCRRRRQVAPGRSGSCRAAAACRLSAQSRTSSCASVSHSSSWPAWKQCPARHGRGRRRCGAAHRPARLAPAPPAHPASRPRAACRWTASTSTSASRARVTSGANCSWRRSLKNTRDTSALVAPRRGYCA